MKTTAKTIYHETLWDAVQAGLDAVPAGHAVEIRARETASPMSYEQTQTLRLDLTADAGVNRKARRQTLLISVYRMSSGRYEVTAYAA